MIMPPLHSFISHSCASSSKCDGAMILHGLTAKDRIISMGVSIFFKETHNEVFTATFPSIIQGEWTNFDCTRRETTPNADHLPMLIHC